MVILDSNPDNLPDEYLRAIGRIIVCASIAENSLRTAIGVFLKIDNIEALALTASLSAPIKDKVLRAIIELNASSVSMVDRLDDILDKIINGMEQRNAVAHKSFHVLPDDGQVVMWREKVKGSIQLELKPVSIDELNEIANNLLDASHELTTFLGNVGGPQFRNGLLSEPLKRTKAARDERRAQHAFNIKV